VRDRLFAVRELLASIPGEGFLRGASATLGIVVLTAGVVVGVVHSAAATLLATGAALLLGALLSARWERMRAGPGGTMATATQNDFVDVVAATQAAIEEVVERLVQPGEREGGASYLTLRTNLRKYLQVATGRDERAGQPRTYWAAREAASHSVDGPDIEVRLDLPGLPSHQSFECVIVGPDGAEHSTGRRSWLLHARDGRLAFRFPDDFAKRGRALAAGEYQVRWLGLSTFVSARGERSETSQTVALDRFRVVPAAG
jgi:hypothetical protein